MNTFSCPHCSRPVQFARRVTAAVTVRCPHCMRTFRVEPGKATPHASPVRNFRQRQLRRPPQFLPLILGAVATLLAVVLLLWLFRAAAHRTPEVTDRTAPAQPQPAAQRQPPPREAEPDGSKAVRWPPLTPENFPGLPSGIVAGPPAVQPKWGFAPGQRYLYAGRIEASAALSPIDLGRTARNVLQFSDRKELQIELQCEREDAGVFLIRCELKRLSGSMKAPSGRLEYDSRDGPGFLPPDEPLAKVVRRPWLARVAARGELLRLEWTDGTLVEATHEPTLRSITPVVALPEQLPHHEAEVEQREGTLVCRTRYLGTDPAGNAVFAQLRYPSEAPSAENTERVLVVFDVQLGVVRALHSVSSRRTGTGLPRVGRFRPTLRTVKHLWLVR